MTQRDFNWHKKKTVKKGDYGEELVKEYLENTGYKVYTTDTPGQHEFDILSVNFGGEWTVVEVKTKPMRLYYPDTGIDERHYKRLNEIQKKHNHPVFIYFVDEHLKEIYGNYLDELKEPCIIEGHEYPLHQKGIVYFPIKKMKREMVRLNDEQVEKIKKHNTMNYEYD